MSEAGEGKFCTGCGIPLLPSWNFCSGCGTPVPEEEVVPEGYTLYTCTMPTGGQGTICGNKKLFYTESGANELCDKCAFPDLSRWAYYWPSE